jgi:hypothetical protein
VKIPQENHPLFHACLPRDPRVSTVKMFGGVAAKVNGQMLSVMDERDELRGWLRKALDFTASLPAKKTRPPTRSASKKAPSTATKRPKR